MIDRLDRARPFLPALCLAILPALALACAPQTPAKTGAAAASPAQQGSEGEKTAEPAAPEVRKPARGFDFPLEPPDGKWLTDERGRRYWVHEVAKIEGTYSKQSDGTRVKFWYTPPFELVREDESSFYVKIYGIPDPSLQPPAPAAKPAEAPAKATATAEGDRLRFEPWAQGLPTRGQWRQGFDVADVNGDGHLDIVHGPPRKGGTAPAIFLGDGKGHWQRWGALRMPDRPLDYGDAAAADFNGDGVMDLAFASHLIGLSVLVGDGKGGFSLWSQGLDYLIPGKSKKEGVFTSRAIEVVDWNRDGRPDLLALGEGPSFSVERSQTSARYGQGARGPVIFLNQGDGTWRRQEAGGSAFGDALAVGNFDGDDRLDLLVASANMGGQNLLYVGREEGTLQETNLESLRPSSVFRAVAAADFDGDGRQDLAVGYTAAEGEIWRTGVDVLLARPNGTWERRALGDEESQAGIWGLAAGDLDGDGAADLAAATGDGQLWVFLGEGKGGFAREKSPELALPDLTGCTGYHVALADLDGDGAAELVAGFAGEGGLGEALAGTEPACPSGGSLRAWKPVRGQGGR